jgi:hypothetical protein
VTPEQLVAVLGAITALIVAIGGLYVQFAQLHRQLNSRMDQLLELTKTSATAEGKLQGQTGTTTGQEKSPA